MTGLLIGEVFRSAARAVPHRTAALVGDRALTFAELDAAADRTARHLAAHGVRRGDRVVCPVAASPETLAAFAAAARAGAVFVPVDAGSGDAWAGRVARIVRAARPRLLVTDAARAGSGARLAAGSGVRHVVLADVGEDGVPDDKAEGPPAARPEESDPHVILFTEPTGDTVVGAHQLSDVRWSAVFDDVERIRERMRIPGDARRSGVGGELPHLLGCDCCGPRRVVERDRHLGFEIGTPRRCTGAPTTAPARITQPSGTGRSK